jgi:HK97 family phage major capsid protein
VERLSELTARMQERAPPGRLAERALRALVMSRGSQQGAADFARSTRWIEAQQLGEIFSKAAVGSMTPTSQAELFSAVGQDLLALARPFSIFDRLRAGFRHVPARTQLVTQTGGAAGYWVDQYAEGGHAIPASALAFSRSPGLEERRVAAMVVADEELARVSMPSVDTTFATDLARALSATVDSAFLNPLVSGSPAAQPASVTSSGRIFTSSGSDLASIDADLELLATAVHDGGGDLTSSWWFMNDLTLTRLSRMRGSGGALAYPNLSIVGGTLMGLPVLASAHITRAGSPSPGATYLGLICPSRVWVTANDAVTISGSRYASIEMSSAPTMDASSGTGAASVPLWQVESVALKAVRYLGWQPTAGDGHAASLINVEY